MSAKTDASSGGDVNMSFWWVLVVIHTLFARDCLMGREFLTMS